MLTRFKETAKTKVRNLISGGQFPLHHGMEPVYQRIFQRDLAKIGVEDVFYPVAGAANYSLLYLLTRIAREVPVKSILELGAGQSSILLDALSKTGLLSATITTLEHDADWANHISSKVAHEVVTTSLKKHSLNGIQFLGYDFSPILGRRNIELLLVDGPPASTATTEFSRLGALELVEFIDPVDFIVVLDDTERPAEMMLADGIEQALRSKNIKFQKGQIITSKRQIIFAAGKFERVVYF